MNKNICQEVLHDCNGRREKPWAQYKILNQYLALAYDEIDEKKAGRLRDCATYLEFTKEGDKMFLKHANFCRVRLCPVCAWRRSLKTYGQMRACMQALGNDYRYIFLTLTMRNCDGGSLKKSIDRLLQGFNRLLKYKDVQRAVKGFYRGLEITHNIDNDTYHPHIHCILAVAPSYFKSRYYLSHDKWLALWCRAMQDTSITQVDVRALKGSCEHACAEVAKYSVKPKDIICFDDWDLTVDTVRVLDEALKGRRLIGFGGCFLDVHRKLHLDDADDGDLTHIETDVHQSDVDEKIIAYAWHTGYSQYLRR